LNFIWSYKDQKKVMMMYLHQILMGKHWKTIKTKVTFLIHALKL